MTLDLLIYTLESQQVSYIIYVRESYGYENIVEEWESEI